MKKISLFVAFCLFGLALSQDELPEVRASVSKPLASPGDDVTVTCTVDNLEGPPEDYVVIIYKSVTGNLVAGPLSGSTDAYELIATNNFLSPLYSKNGRYSATRDTSGDEKVITLTIKNVTDEESGYYTCQLSGNVLYDSAVLEIVEIPSMVTFTNLTTNLTLVEGVVPTIQCQVGPALPVPHVSISIGHDASGWSDITSNFIKTTKTNINCPSTGGNPDSKACLLNMDSSTNMTSHSYVPDFRNDYKYLKCEAHVPGTDSSKTVSSKVMLDLSYSPKFVCDKEVETKVGVRSFRVNCQVHFNPGLNETEWSFQMNGRTVTLKSGEVKEGITATEFTLEQGFGEERQTQFTLTFDRIEKKHFTKYTLTASNALGINSTGIVVSEEIKVPPQGSSSSKSAFSLSMTFLGLLAYCFA